MIYEDDGEVVGQIYMRKSWRILPPLFAVEGKVDLKRCLDLATIDISEEHRGQGYFRRISDNLLNRNLWPHEFLFVENVHDYRFQRYFVRNGWTQTGDENLPCFFRRLQKAVF